jgi:DNA-binding MarR family transcriptional regulator
VDIETIRRYREKIRKVERGLGVSQRNDIQCCGVTMAQCHALLAIGERQEISIVELAGVLDVDTSNLSRTVDGLVKSGLLDRRLNPQDRRYVSLALTGAGKEAFGTIERLSNLYLDRVFEFIPEEKHAQIMESLDLVASALEKCGGKYGCCDDGSGEERRDQDGLLRK